MKVNHELGYKKIMDNITTSTQTVTKDEFKGMVARITSALEQHDQVYPALIAQAAPFDKVLAQKLAKAAEADAELLQYIKNKAEAGEAKGIIATITGLLLGR